MEKGLGAAVEMGLEKAEMGLEEAEKQWLERA